MQPPSTAEMNSLLTPLQDLQNQIQTAHHYDDFLEQMLSTIPSCSWSDLKSPWVDLNPAPNLTVPIHASKLRDLSDETAPDGNVGFNFDESVILASKFRNRQISGGLQQQQQLLMGANQGEGLFNGFGGPNQTQHFQASMQPQSFNAQSGAISQQQPSGGSGGAPAPAQPKQRVRARRGQATDPHSIAERLRRERIAERMKALQELVPNANKTDKASMLDEIIDYVKFLQLQVKVLSMSRLGGAAAVAPLVADISSEGNGGDSVQANSNGVPGPTTLPRASNQTPSSNDSLTVTEHQVAKLMEEDMGSAMQYLQGKGLCLMPISLATAISTATCHNRSSFIPNSATNNLHHALLQSNGDGPTSPSMSVLTVQSATLGNGVTDVSVKDAASVSKP